VTEEVIEKTISSENAIKAAPKSSNGMWIGIIVLLVVVLIAGAGFYFYQLLRSQSDDINKESQQFVDLEKRITGFQTQLAAMQTQLTEATSTISNADARFEDKLLERTKAQEEKLEAARKELTTAVLQIQRQLGKTRGDWLLADAEYLLSVAGQRLHLIGDLQTTREALEAADQRLRESGDAGAIKVREQVAKELASLRAVPPIDLVGMYSQLNSLSDRVNQLTLFLPYQGKPVVKNSEHDKHAASSKTSSDMLDGVLKKFDNYVTIRHTDQPIKAILTAEQADFIRQQLSLKLEMIKVALVQKNQTLYHAGLTDALEWLDKNFNKNTETQRFMAELKQLDSVKLNAQLPDISLSLKMLRDISKLRIETDKALPAVELELKVEQPEVEEIKPQAVEAAEPKAVNAPVPNTQPVSPEIKTEKPATNNPTADAKLTVEKPVPANSTNTTEVKKTENSTAIPIIKEPAKTTTAPTQPAVKAAESLVTSDSKKTNAASVTKPANTSIPSSETKKVTETAITTDKTAAKAESTTKNAEKNPAPVIAKPVVVH
jgi:uncharacterized protein HemX